MTARVKNVALITSWPQKTLPLSRWLTAREPLGIAPLAQVHDRRQGPPVAAALSHQVEMRGPPVLHEGGPTVPPDTAIQFLQICRALGAGRDEVALVP